jgi:hypothetical protein
MDEKKDETTEDEKVALLCIRSLVNISKDLKRIEQPVLSRLANFIAAGLLDIYRPVVPEAQFHGGQTPHKSNIKDEIKAAIAQIRGEGKDVHEIRGEGKDVHEIRGEGKDVHDA